MLPVMPFASMPAAEQATSRDKRKIAAVVAAVLLLLLTVPTAFVVIQLELKVIALMQLRLGGIPRRNLAEIGSSPLGALRS